MEAMAVGGWHRFPVMATLAVFILAIPRPSAARPRAHARIEYQSEVNIVAGNFKTPQHGAGVILEVSITSGEFFKGLVRTAGPSGVQFLKDGKQVSYFPKKLDVRIEAAAFGGGPSRTPWQLGPALDTDFVRSLRFSIATKQGLQEVPAQVISSRAYEVPFRERGPDRWEYELVVRLNHAPLTDLLTVVVLSDDGKMLARFTGGLGRPFVSWQPNGKAKN
jgi:hypothetical protein